MDDSKLLQESNLATRQPRRVPHRYTELYLDFGGSDPLVQLSFSKLWIV